MQRLFLGSLPLVLCILSSTLSAADLDQAPKSFSANGGKAVPVDFQQVALNLDFDPATQKAVGRCEIEFTSQEEGFPFFDLS